MVELLAFCFFTATLPHLTFDIKISEKHPMVVKLGFLNPFVFCL